MQFFLTNPEFPASSQPNRRHAGSHESPHAQQSSISGSRGSSSQQRASDKRRQQPGTAVEAENRRGRRVRGPARQPGLQFRVAQGRQGQPEDDQPDAQGRGGPHHGPGEAEGRRVDRGQEGQSEGAAVLDARDPLGRLQVAEVRDAPARVAGRREEGLQAGLSGRASG